ncbi:beta-galactosidase [Streptomyces sp. HMX87]|uniref:beta-galactosidase n=1 Tax=Streptomyces sp. HMX87 TaxID=3390849 RepID=UPI003A865279
MELTRRTFSALAGTTVLGLTLGGGSIGTAHPSDAGLGVLTGPPPPPPTADGRRHQVGFDRSSLLVDGRRLLLWPGELHAFRLPSPSLWRDVLQRMRAHGYNAVSVPVPWNQHCPAPGRHDFTGVRDLDLLLRTAAEEHLYVILRPGPYLGGDGLDAGGLPGWLTAAEARARTTDPGYLRHADAWLTAVDAVAARHLYTRGGGTVLLYELEDAPDSAYRTRLRRKVRADGIDVPLVRGYAERRPTHGAADERQQRLARLAEGGARPNVSLAFGGTSWGWLPAAGATAAHGAGAAIDAGRQPTDELAVTHQLGHLLRHVPDLARLDRAPEVRASDERLAVTHLANPDTGAHVYVLRNDADTAVSARLPGTAVETPVTLPAGDARLLVTGLTMGGRRKLAYATVQPMAFLTAGRWDIAVFTGRRGETAHVVLDCPSDPQPTRLDREAAWAYERGRLHVTAPLGEGGLTRVRVEGGGSDRTLLLLFADDDTSLRLWPCTVPSGTFLVYGPALLRSAAVREGTVVLTGDVVDDLGVEVWGPHGATQVSWNGGVLRDKRGLDGSMTAERRPQAAPSLVLPVLGGWRRRTENPESAPGFDDGDWTVADKRTSAGPTPVPGHQPVLFADDYGFHYGDVWYRGRLTNAAGVESVSLTWGAGTGGVLMAWLDGEPLGTRRMPEADDAAAGRRTRTATARFPVPARLRGRLRAGGATGTPVLSVLVRPMGHSAEADARGTHKTARGLIGASFEGAVPEVRWRLQGAAGPDPVRGPLNNGGLYGERHGWHLPGHDDGGWEAVTLPRADRRQGVTWYRTAFRLEVPPDVDASIGLALADDPGRAYRVQVFLNGWNLGQYVNGGGPPHTFALPGGLLRTRGAANTLALAVLADGDTPAGPGEVRLKLLGAAAGGVPVTPVDSPGR